MFDALFEALFSYRPVVFREGDFRFDVRSASLVATLIVGVVVAAAIFTSRRVQVADGRLRDRIIMTTIRVPALELVLFCLFLPTLVVSESVKQQIVWEVLIFDSRIMHSPALDVKALGTYV